MPAYLVYDWQPQSVRVEEPVSGAGHHDSETLDGDVPAVLLRRSQPDSGEVDQLQLKKKTENSLASLPSTQELRQYRRSDNFVQTANTRCLTFNP